MTKEDVEKVLFAHPIRRVQIKNLRLEIEYCEEVNQLEEMLVLEEQLAFWEKEYEILSNKLQLLSEDDYMLIKLKYFKRKRVAEIIEELGITKWTYHKRKQKILKWLQEIM